MKRWLTPLIMLLCTLCAAILLALFPDYAAWAGWVLYGIGCVLIFWIFLKRYRTEKTNSPKVEIDSSESSETNRGQLDEIRSRIRERKREKKNQQEDTQ